MSIPPQASCRACRMTLPPGITECVLCQLEAERATADRSCCGEPTKDRRYMGRWTCRRCGREVPEVSEVVHV